MITYSHSRYFTINDNFLFWKIVTPPCKRVFSLTFDFQHGLSFSKQPLKLHRRCAECRVAIVIDSLSSSYPSHSRFFFMFFLFNNILICESIISNAINNIKQNIYLEYLQIQGFLVFFSYVNNKIRFILRVTIIFPLYL